ncbi:MAG: hypothetical protein KAI62_08720 [Actinomycetia bacterium]|nr:hypothetical protein [Actinomycetes bacterium]
MIKIGIKIRINDMGNMYLRLEATGRLEIILLLKKFISNFDIGMKAAKIPFRTLIIFS